MKLHYKVLGKGDPIIILHGMFGMLDNWMSIGKELSTKFKVYLIDQRNHGKSPHIDKMNYHLMVEDLYTFMQHEKIKQPHIIGHSMGGKTAMQLAFNHPGLINKLVVVDILPTSYSSGHDLIFESMCQLDLSKIDSRAAADEFLSKTISDFRVRQFLLKNLTRSATGQFKWKMNLPVIRHSYQNLLASVDHDWPYNEQVLLIKGAFSDYIGPQEESKFYDFFPNAKIVTIPDAGHWIHADQPTAFLEAINSFLK